MRPTLNPSQRAAVQEGADELKSRLRADLSRWFRVRRHASLGPTVGCIACDAKGRSPCVNCGGAGRIGPVVDGQQAACTNCDATGNVTCIDCAGSGLVPNVHRKKVIVLLSLGCLAWLVVLFWLWGGDVAPEFRANLRGEGGGQSMPEAARRGVMQAAPSGAPGPGVSAPGAAAFGGGAPAGQGAFPQGGGQTGAQGGVYQQGGGVSGFQGGGASTYRGGAVPQQGGGVSYPPR